MRADLRLQEMRTRIERLPLELAAARAAKRQLLIASEGSFCRTIAASAVPAAKRIAANVRCVHPLNRFGNVQTGGAPRGVDST